MIRIGTGYDIHPLVQNQPLILGGVAIPAEKGCIGHSDADVLLHAIIDALLGATALGDIGEHFPLADPQYKGISSRLLLKQTKTIITEHGFSIGNIDATVILEKPKLLPYRDEMRRTIALDLEIPFECVSIKAKTKEHLDATGAGLAVEVHAAVLVEKTLDPQLLPPREDTDWL